MNIMGQTLVCPWRHVGGHDGDDPMAAVCQRLKRLYRGGLLAHQQDIHRNCSLLAPRATPFEANLSPAAFEARSNTTPMWYNSSSFGGMSRMNVSYPTAMYLANSSATLLYPPTRYGQKVL